MAFVFRSEKKKESAQDCRNEISKSEETVQAREVRQGNIFKGLPHLISKDTNNSHKENDFPTIQANPIHPGSFNFNNTVFRVREFNDAKLSSHAQSSEKAPVIIVKQINTEKLALSMAKLQSKKLKSNNQSTKEIHQIKEESPAIVSKNLLKTMIHLSEKKMQKHEIDKIAINESKDRDVMPKKNRLREWKSLKKLSPLKDYSNFNQTAETDGINISCGTLKAKQQDPIKKKEVKVKINTKKLYDSAQEMQEDEQEYITEATPGPGAYTYDFNSKKQFRSKRKKFQKIFYSQIERFQQNQKKFQEVTYINEDNQASSKEPSYKQNSQPFLSKSPKFPQNRQCDSPPPGYYDTRQTLEHDLVRHILKSSNSTTFINRSPRVYKVKGGDMPGPGTYVLDKSLQKLIQEKNQLSFSYKSQLQRKIGNCVKIKQPAKQISLIQEGENTNPIHIKEDSIREDYYFTEPVPFLSSTERFPLLQPPPKMLPRSDFKPDNIPKPNPPRQPFNSSQRRETMGKVGQGIGIGLYNLCKDSWSKKSYNILYN